MARNVVERIFGIIKRRFSLMVASPEYSEQKQAKLIPALCVLHNFISVYDQDVTRNAQHQAPGMVNLHPTPLANLPRPAWVSEQEEISASARRDNIANEMWVDYQRYLTQREIQ